MGTKKLQLKGISDDDIQKGCDEAYKRVGLNAYFGNGFKAGVKFAEENSISFELLEALHDCVTTIEWLVENGNVNQNLLETFCNMSTNSLDISEKAINKALK